MPMLCDASISDALHEPEHRREILEAGWEALKQDYERLHLWASRLNGLARDMERQYDTMYGTCRSCDGEPCGCRLEEHGTLEEKQAACALFAASNALTQAYYRVSRKLMRIERVLRQIHDSQRRVA